MQHQKKNYGYVRVSTEDQLKGFSVDNQIMTLNRTAKILDIQLDHIYADEAKSAFKDVKRLEFEELIKEVKACHVNYLIVWKSDRLIRNHIKNEQLFLLFSKNNVKIISCTEGELDFTTADGRANIRKKGVENQYESERTSERVTASLFTAARLGNYPKSHIPLGYKRIHNEFPTAPITPDEITGPLVKKIFETIANERWGIKKLIKWLNSNQYMNRVWYERILYHMLSDPIYKGTYVNLVSKPTLIIENHTPSLISEELFNSVQDLIHSRHYERKYTYVFKKIIYCNKCGKLLTPTPAHNGHSKKLFLYYYCNNCNKRVNEDRIQEHVIDEFNTKIDKIFRKGTLQNLQNKIVRIKHLIAQNDMDFINQVIDEEFHKQQKKDLLKCYKSCSDELNTYMNTDILYWSKMNVSDKRVWLKEYIERINYDFDTKMCIIKYRK